MARVTIEDCLDNVDNRFELILVASKRAKQLATGQAEPKVSVDNDKPTVLALREIADGLVDRSILDEPDLPSQNLHKALLAPTSGHGFNQF